MGEDPVTGHPKGVVVDNSELNLARRQIGDEKMVMKGEGSESWEVDEGGDIVADVVGDLT